MLKNSWAQYKKGIVYLTVCLVTVKTVSPSDQTIFAFSLFIPNFKMPLEDQLLPDVFLNITHFFLPEGSFLGCKLLLQLLEFASEQVWF